MATFRNYIRVSSIDQNTERQLFLDGIDYIDKASGKDAKREQLQQMLIDLVPGDTVRVHSLDRLGRSTVDVLNIIQSIIKRGCGFACSDNTSLNVIAGDAMTPQAEMMMTIFAGVAKLERDMIRKRQAEGIAIAKAKGIYKGRTANPNQDMMVKDALELTCEQWRYKWKLGRSYYYKLKKNAPQELRKEEYQYDLNVQTET